MGSLSGKWYLNEYEYIPLLLSKFQSYSNNGAKMVSWVNSSSQSRVSRKAISGFYVYINTSVSLTLLQKSVLICTQYVQGVEAK